jgi:hypothetical protein
MEEIICRNKGKKIIAYILASSLYRVPTKELVQGAHKRTLDFQKDTEKRRGAQAPSYLLQTMKSRSLPKTTGLSLISKTKFGEDKSHEQVGNVHFTWNHLGALILWAALAARPNPVHFFVRHSSNCNLG